MRAAKPKLGPGTLWLRPQGSEPGCIASLHAVDTAVRETSEEEIARLESCRGEEIIAPENFSEFESWAPGAIRWIDADPAQAEQDRRLRAALLALKGVGDALRTTGEENLEYHEKTIADAGQQFDLNETTVSHLYRTANPVLNGQNYSEAMAVKLAESGALRSGMSVLEIGGGVGYFARNLLNCLRKDHPEVYANLRYWILDLSPALQASQRDLCTDHLPKMEFICANALEQEFGNDEFDLIICNEMIADLPIGRADLENTKNGKATNEAEELMLRYQLDHRVDIGRHWTVGVGVIRLVERICRWLKPGAQAVITEYGDLEHPINTVPLNGHNEFSIHFGNVLQVGQALARHAELHNLGEWLGFDGDREILSQQSWSLLSHSIMPHLGLKPLPRLALSRDDVTSALGEEVLARVGNLLFEPVRVGSLCPFKFYALHLRK